MILEVESETGLELLSISSLVGPQSVFSRQLCVFSASMSIRMFSQGTIEAIVFEVSFFSSFVMVESRTGVRRNRWIT